MTKKSKSNGKDLQPQDLLEEELLRDPQLTEGQAMQLLMIAAETLGWSILIPNVEDDEEVPGIIMGSNEYVDWIANQLTDGTVPDHLKKKIK